uniref:Glycogen synthase kinase-3 like MsK-1 n=1 Tax=Rhizophora mucronata TaxID=61149 RepID=A0A2P2IWK3_RHIMU
MLWHQFNQCLHWHPLQLMGFEIKNWWKKTSIWQAGAWIT